MNSFEQALKDTKSKEKPTAKKSSAPQVKETPDNIKKAVDKYNAAKKAQKEATGEMAAHGAEIIEFTNEIRDTLAFKGKFSKSYDVDGKQTSVKAIATNKFSINPDDKEDIKKMLGKNFDNLIKEEWSVKLKAEILEDDKLQKELMKLIGARFAEFFESTSTLKVVENFDEKIYSVVKNQEELDELRTVVKQAKPSLK